jgi:hypothetical protein
MPLVKLECAGCGGRLEFNPESSTRRIMNCPYCGTPYLEKQEINYNQYNTQIEHLHADVVRIESDQNAQARIKAGNDNLSLNRFNSALKDFKDASQLAPGNYLVWWGQIRAISHDFTAPLERKSELKELQKLFGYAKQKAPDQEKLKLEQIFLSYINPLLNQNAQNVAYADNALRQLHGAKNWLETELQLWINKSYSEIVFPKGVFWFVAIILGICISAASENRAMVFIAFIPGIALFLMILIRPISNIIARSKEKEKQQQIYHLNQQLSITHTKICELSQKYAYWIS